MNFIYRAACSLLAVSVAFVLGTFVYTVAPYVAAVVRHVLFA